VKPADGVAADDFQVNRRLDPGTYRLGVHFRGDEVYRKDFSIQKGGTAPEINLGILVEEEGMVQSRGALNLFGYRARQVPRAPNPGV
jgi:hypothetical protein